LRFFWGSEGDFEKIYNDEERRLLSSWESPNFVKKNWLKSEK